MTRVSQFMADCMSVGALRGFQHFSVHIRSREELILRVCSQPAPNAFPICSLTISSHLQTLQDNNLQMHPTTQQLMHSAGEEMSATRDLSDLELEKDTGGVNFLIAGYPKYKCPYVWLRTDHQRLVDREDSTEAVVDKDMPLRLESIDCWRQFDIRPWDVLVEVICTCLQHGENSLENPFTLDYGYFEQIPLEERLVVTGAMLEFLRRVYLRHYFFSDLVLADIKRLQKQHFMDINVLRESA